MAEMPSLCLRSFREAFFWANQMNTNFIKAAAWWLITLLIALWWLSPDKQYVTELEKVVARCIDGGAVTVGNEVYLCNVYNTGERT